MIVNVAGIDPNSLVNGPGLRYVLYVQGCKHHCKGCHNEHTWSFGTGKNMFIEEIFEDIKKNIPLIKGITLSGGDPMEQAEPLYYLCKRVKEELGLNIWCYTGYTYEDIIYGADKNKEKLLKTIDTLVDGKFEENNTNGEHKYIGSNNQRIIHFY